MIPYLQVKDITKSFGDLVLFENIRFTVAKDQRVALIGNTLRFSTHNVTKEPAGKPQALIKS